MKQIFLYKPIGRRPADFQDVLYFIYRIRALIYDVPTVNLLYTFI